MSSVDDLITFLRARLDEDEQAALDWQRHKSVLTEQFMNDPRRKHVRPRREPVTDAQVAEYAYNNRFDPACALREVEAKRRLVNMHEGEHECRDIRTGVYPPDAHLMGKTPGEPWMHYTTEHFADVPCATLKVLALPYADHHGYREEWRP